MMSFGRQSESRWRKDPSELNVAVFKEFTRKYSNAIKLAKRAFNIKIISEMANQQIEFFHIACILAVPVQPQYGNLSCDQFAA